MSAIEHASLDSIEEAFADHLADQLTHTHRMAIDWLREKLRRQFQARGLSDEDIDGALLLGETSALIDALNESDFSDEQRDTITNAICDWVQERRKLEDLR